MLTDTPVLVLIFISLALAIVTSTFCFLVQVKQHKLDTVYTVIGVFSTTAAFAICYGLNSQIAPAAIYVG